MMVPENNKEDVMALTEEQRQAVIKQGEARWGARGLMGNQQVAPMQSPVRPPTKRPQVVTQQEVQRAPNRYRSDGSVAQQGTMSQDKTYPQGKSPRWYEGISAREVLTLGPRSSFSDAYDAMQAEKNNPYKGMTSTERQLAMQDQPTGWLGQKTEALPGAIKDYISTIPGSGAGTGRRPGEAAAKPTTQPAQDTMDLQVPRGSGYQEADMGEGIGITELTPPRPNLYGTGPGIRTIRDERTGRTVHTNLDNQNYDMQHGSSNFIQKQGGPRLEGDGLKAALGRQADFNKEMEGLERQTAYYNRRNAGGTALGSGGVTDEGIEYATGSRMDPNRRTDWGSLAGGPASGATLAAILRIQGNQAAGAARGEKSRFDRSLAVEELKTKQAHADAALMNATAAGVKGKGVEFKRGKPVLDFAGKPTGQYEAGSYSDGKNTYSLTSEDQEMLDAEARTILERLMGDMPEGADQDALIAEAYKQAFGNVVGNRRLAQ